ncbi:hypothetical protein WJX74_006643 [Apatococcus lobatus]|uniref:Uncharacterized protein n=1 Tax=Apatococcus lobatus TaxID=904363 RepID=A0AAW1SFI2_9CHLO
MHLARSEHPCNTFTAFNSTDLRAKQAFMGNWRELASLQPFGWDNNSAEPVGQSLLKDFEGITSGRPQRRRQSAPPHPAQAARREGKTGACAKGVADDQSPHPGPPTKHERSTEPPGRRPASNKRRKTQTPQTVPRSRQPVPHSHYGTASPACLHVKEPQLAATTITQPLPCADDRDQISQAARAASVIADVKSPPRTRNKEADKENSTPGAVKPGRPVPDFPRRNSHAKMVLAAFSASYGAGAHQHTRSPKHSRYSTASACRNSPSDQSQAPTHALPLLPGPASQLNSLDDACEAAGFREASMAAASTALSPPMQQCTLQHIQKAAAGIRRPPWSEVSPLQSRSPAGNSQPIVQHPAGPRAPPLRLLPSKSPDMTPPGDPVAAGINEVADSRLHLLASPCLGSDAARVAQGNSPQKRSRSPGPYFGLGEAVGQAPKGMPPTHQPMRKGPSPKMPRLSIPTGFTESPQKRPRAPPSPHPPAGIPQTLQQLLLGFQAGSLLPSATPGPVPTPHLEIAALNVGLPPACKPLHMSAATPRSPLCCGAAASKDRRLSLGDQASFDTALEQHLQRQGPSPSVASFLRWQRQARAMSAAPSPCGSNAGPSHLISIAQQKQAQDPTDNTMLACHEAPKLASALGPVTGIQPHTLAAREVDTASQLQLAARQTCHQQEPLNDLPADDHPDKAIHNEPPRHDASCQACGQQHRQGIIHNFAAQSMQPSSSTSPLPVSSCCKAEHPHISSQEGGEQPVQAHAAASQCHGLGMRQRQEHAAAECAQRKSDAATSGPRCSSPAAPGQLLDILPGQAASARADTAEIPIQPLQLKHAFQATQDPVQSPKFPTAAIKIASGLGEGRQDTAPPVPESQLSLQVAQPDSDTIAQCAAESAPTAPILHRLSLQDQQLAKDRGWGSIFQACALMKMVQRR